LVKDGTNVKPKRRWEKAKEDGESTSNVPTKVAVITINATASEEATATVLDSQEKGEAKGEGQNKNTKENLAIQEEESEEFPPLPEAINNHDQPVPVATSSVLP
jgi:hypothetical protein